MPKDIDPQQKSNQSLVERNAGEGRNAAQSVVFRAPYSQVNIPNNEADDHAIMRARQLSAILHVMPIVGYSENMIRLASRLADDLAQAIKDNGEGSLLASQLAELLLKVQGDDGPCDLLWLCQQIADELDEMMSSMTTERSMITEHCAA